MADRSSQQAFGFRGVPVSRLRPGEIVVDLFAGGGGANLDAVIPQAVAA